MVTMFVDYCYGDDDDDDDDDDDYYHRGPEPRASFLRSS